jgi:hypothetical protein
MTKAPVFIIGINPRSGTNYLYQILALHPDCVHSKHYGEDFILYGIENYIKFYKTVTSKWVPTWNNNKEEFKKSLEIGLMSYLDPGGAESKYVITKTPHPQNAELFLEAFSKGYMIIITRKGQDLVQSFMTTFNSRFDDATRGWKRGAESIHNVINDKKLMDSGRIIVIKYEDLYQKNEETMVKLLNFLNLDISKYDFQKSKNFDVIGSSTFKGNSEKATWDPIPKNESFNPLGRFKDWSILRHYRYNWMAGKLSKEFGYELYHETKNPFYYIYNIVVSIYDFFVRMIRRLFLTPKSSRTLNR